MVVSCRQPLIDGTPTLNKSGPRMVQMVGILLSKCLKGVHSRCVSGYSIRAPSPCLAPKYLQMYSHPTARQPGYGTEGAQMAAPLLPPTKIGNRECQPCIRCSSYLLGGAISSFCSRYPHVEVRLSRQLLRLEVLQNLRHSRSVFRDLICTYVRGGGNRRPVGCLSYWKAR